MADNQNTNESGKHKRRVHYSGKYPKKFEEKYKEQNPEKYADIAEHVMEKGSTPAGMHISIMVKEILDVLKIKPGEKGLDATLGYGGHTTEMLKCLDGKGHICGLDVDPIEQAKTVERLRKRGFDENIFTPVLINFANIDEVAEKYGKFDFILADLGVSSMQIDNPERGFSYKTEGPLDLRLNQTSGITAAERLKGIKYGELKGMLEENSDEPYADKIANAVMKRNKSGNYIEKTTDLKEVIEEALDFLPKEEKKDIIKKSCARTFQALRIDINCEFEVLFDFLEKLPKVCNPGARIAILTFHSGEDRLVKQSFRELKRAGIYSEISEDVIRPSKEECIRNPRAKSTKLRFAVRGDGSFVSQSVPCIEERPY